MEGVILTMNDGAEQIFGYKKEELIGKKRVSIFPLVKLFYKMSLDGLTKLLKAVVCWLISLIKTSKLMQVGITPIFKW